MNMIPPLDFFSLIAKLPKRPLHAHKGDFGHVLVVGGDFGYAGAPILAGLGALRSGAGLVTIASHQQNLLGLNASHPELMTCAIDKPRNIENALQKATVVVLGPGLGRSAWSQRVFKIIMQTKQPLIIDADGLFFLAQHPRIIQNCILTPHPGEAATLLGLHDAIPEAQRVIAINKLIQTYVATIALKGANTLVGSNNQNIAVCTAGNPAMASGGMGDLLSGIIAGLVAQKMPLDCAAKLGVCVHAKAGDLAAAHIVRGIIASDLLNFIPKILSSN